jgi:hypothetical protein
MIWRSRPLVLECEDDEQAMLAAGRFLDGRSLEVWDGSRRLGQSRPRKRNKTLAQDVVKSGHRDFARYPLSLVRNHDGAIILGYIAFAIVMLATIYFASGGSSFTDADLSVMAIMP